MGDWFDNRPLPSQNYYDSSRVRTRTGINFLDRGVEFHDSTRYPQNLQRWQQNELWSQRPSIRAANYVLPAAYTAITNPFKTFASINTAYDAYTWYGERFKTRGRRADAYWFASEGRSRTAEFMEGVKSDAAAKVDAVRTYLAPIPPYVFAPDTTNSTSISKAQVNGSVEQTKKAMSNATSA